MADDATLPAVAEPVALPEVRGPVTPLEMLSRALERGADLGVLEKLMDLADRHEKNEARKAFDQAVAYAKAEIPAIKKNRTGHNQKKYADLAAFAAAADPALARHGLSYRYRTSQNGAIHVTCILAHRDGHCEETTLSGGADNTGNKNSIQAIGSTLTYLQRYTLCAALGLAATEDDDGASSAGDETINNEQLDILLKMVSDAGADVEKMCAYLKVEALPDLRKSQFENARVLLQTKIKAKKKAPQ